MKELQYWFDFISNAMNRNRGAKFLGQRVAVVMQNHVSTLKRIEIYIKQGPALYKEPWTGRAVSHFTLDTELSTSPGHAIRLEAGNSNLLR